MKTEYKIFFAIPFDALAKNTYEKISKKLRDDFKKNGYNLTTVTGSNQIGASPDFSNIMTFRTQNTELHRQFFNEIANSDIIIADLTNDNPNVHIELGIAISLNKNILRVTGRDVNELAFDIRNYEVCKYTKYSELLKKIKEYIEVFIKIKNLDFSVDNKSLYKKISDEIFLPKTDEEVKKDILFSYTVKDYLFRDGAILFKVNLLKCLNDKSWIGVYFRKAPHVYLGSYLLYIRKNGYVELAEYEFNLSILYKEKLFDSLKLNTTIKLLIEIENDQIKASMNGKSVIIKNIKQQRRGEIMLATYDCRAKFMNLELIDRDTIEI